jgi:hypothetical protein
VVVLNYEEVSVEEMWKVIEDFGINRTMLERKHLTAEQVKNLYMLIMGKKQ